MVGKTILIVDDDVEILRRLVVQFTNTGFEVAAAPDGHMAMQLFKARKPDVVLTDIIMPHQEGIETILQMKQASPAVKIIAMSGGGRIGALDVLSLARSLGADAVIPKPFRFNDLWRLVAETLAPGELERQEGCRDLSC